MSRVVKIMGTITRTPIEDLGDPVQALFGDTPGVYYLPSADAAVFQTVGSAVTPAGADDPVGFVQSLSGTGPNSQAPDSAGRPTRKTGGGLWWFEYDGIDDTLKSSATTLPLVAGHTMVIGCNRGAATGGFTFTTQVSTTNSGDFAQMVAEGTGRLRARAAANSLGYAQIQTAVANNEFSAGTDYVLTRVLEPTSGDLIEQINNAAAQTVASNWAPGASIAGTDFYPGAVGGSSSIGFRLYFFFLINRVLTAGELTTVRNAAAAASGVTL